MQHVDLIAEYLLQLQRELVGVDAAVTHDALVDAEAHLRAAIAAGVKRSRAVAKASRPIRAARGESSARRSSAAWSAAGSPGVQSSPSLVAGSRPRYSGNAP
jgi:uncharacterized membrane protein